MPVVYVVFFGLAGASLKLVSTQLLILFAAADIESLRGVFSGLPFVHVCTLACSLLHVVIFRHSSISSSRSLVLCPIE